MTIKDLESRSAPCPTTGCWIWLGAVDRKGYGIIKFKRSKERAHRVARILLGDDVQGMHVDHICGLTCCVNPDHLETVTASENSLRRWRRKR